MRGRAKFAREGGSDEGESEMYESECECECERSKSIVKSVIARTIRNEYAPEAFFTLVVPACNEMREFEHSSVQAFRCLNVWRWVESN